MIPTILVRNTPTSEYLENYSRPGLGQRHASINCLEYHYQIKNILELLVDAGKNKSLELELKKLRTAYYLLEKNIDYCAFLTASLPNVQIIDSYSTNEEILSTTGPYVVRAMASAKIIKLAEKTNQDYVFIENGYFGNYKNSINQKSKKQWHRICINEMQQEEILDVPEDRWKNLLQYDDKLKWTGWKKSGSKILLVVPSSKPCQYYNQDVTQWKNSVISEIKKYTDREIIIREKASRMDRTQKKTIYEALDDDIFCMVTYQSIAAVESVAYGVPVFTLAPSAAKLMGLQDLSKIESPYYPDEELVYKWCCSLAYSQFSLEEMLTGKAWHMVWENKNREKISC